MLEKMNLKVLKIILTFFVIIFINSNFLIAQDQEPCFTLEYSKGCIPFNATAITCPGIENAQYSFNGDPPTSNISFTFREPGIYAVIQFLPGSMGAVTDTLYFEAIEAQTPVFDYTYCSESKIKFNLLDNLYDSIYIDFGDGNQNTYKAIENFEHSYSSPGDKNITIQGFVDSGQPISQQTNCSDTTFTINIVNSLEKAAIDTLKVQEDNKIKLTFELQDHYAYFLEEKIGSGDFNDIQELNNNETSLLLSDKDVSLNTYCYRINTYDSCNVNPNTYLNEICSFQLNVSSEEGFNTLNWTEFTEGSFTDYKIYRNEDLIHTISNVNETTWNDADIKCLEEYCYKVIIETSVDNDSRVFNSITKSSCVIGNTNEKPETVSKLVATIEGENIVLRWESPSDVQIENYILSRSENGNNFTTETLEVNSFIDLNADEVNNQYCYKIQVMDKCGSTSTESVTTCPVKLIAIKESTHNQLEWTDYMGFSDYEYTVEQLDQDGNIVGELAILDKTELKFSHPQNNFNRSELIYRVKISSLDGDNLISHSNIVIITTNPEIDVPDAFSPNNDNINDTFEISVQLLNSFKITIYNRWGNPIFESNSINKSWNGMINGKDASEGTYSYVITGSDDSGRVIQKKGVLLLIR